MRPNFVVGIGGSAGALEAYKALLDELPSTTGMAFVIIFHMHPTATSHLAQILGRHTKMPVVVAADAKQIQANHVYVIPPDSDLLIEGNAFKIISPRIARNRQVDFFLTSLADAKGDHAVGVILSGYDGDGAQGCTYVKAKGGTTFAQDRSAEVDDMPLSAEATGSIDFVLPVKKIALQLQRMSKLDGAAAGKRISPP